MGLQPRWLRHPKSTITRLNSSIHQSNLPGTGLAMRRSQATGQIARAAYEANHFGASRTSGQHPITHGGTRTADANTDDGGRADLGERATFEPLYATTRFGVATPRWWTQP